MERYFPGFASCFWRPVDRFKESGPKHYTGCVGHAKRYTPAPDLGHSKMGRNEASRQSVGSRLRQN